MSRRPPTPSSAPARADAYDFLQDEGDDRRPLHGAIAVAVAVHIALLIVNFPNWQGRADTPEPPERRIFVIEQPKFKPPPPTPETPPPKPTTRPVPMPDPTPDEAEPLVLDTPEPDIVPDVDIIFLDGLEPPPEPAPEPTGPVRLGGEITPPARVHYVEPRYTEMARKTRTQGSVVVQLTVDESGTVSDVQVIKGLPMGLTEEVLKAVRLWRFEPATLNGKPVAVFYNLTVFMNLS